MAVSFPGCAMNSSLALPVQDPSQAGEARRAAAEWAGSHSWDEELRGRLALVVTELGRNLALHTTHGGTLLLRTISDGKESGAEVLSLDDGPGMASFQECARDGFSTAGTAGTGLGAVQRASQRFGVHSQPGTGTVLAAELFARGSAPETPPRWDCGAVSVPAPGELACGDSWAEHAVRPGVCRVMIADGLGHGAFAADASCLAVSVFARSRNLDLPAVMENIHGALRTTRGAAVALAEIDLAGRTLTYVGVGNIAATILQGGESTSLISMNGTIGANFRAARPFIYPWPPGALLVMASDGLKNQWPLSRYPGLAEKTPSLVAGVLYRDFRRGRDDATAVVLREQL